MTCLDASVRQFLTRLCSSFWSTPVRGHARLDILRMGGGGVGWDVNVHCDCSYKVRSLTLPHTRHATQLHVLMHFHTYAYFHTYVMLRSCTFSCTSTHIRHATLLQVLLHFGAHTSCYAAARSLALPHAYVIIGFCTFRCTSTHIHHATPLQVLMHFHTYVMLRCCTFSCTSTHIHTSCYAAARSLSLPHAYIRHVTLLHVLVHFHTSGSRMHIKTADNDLKEIGSTCMLHSGARVLKAKAWQPRTTLRLESKENNLLANPSASKTPFSSW